jgi:hypothetical protein
MFHQNANGHKNRLSLLSHPAVLLEEGQRKEARAFHVEYRSDVKLQPRKYIAELQVCRGCYLIAAAC